MAKDNNKVELELSDNLLQKFKETFDIEMELLRGEQTKMENGQWKCIIHVSDEKVELLKKFVNHMMSIPTDQVKVKVMGVEMKQN